MTSQPLGELIDALFDLRTQKTALVAQVKEIEDNMEDMQHRILSTMEVLGTDTGRTLRATATATTKTRYNVVDSDELNKWVAEEPQERLHLFVKMLNQAAVTEMMELGGEDIPGTGKFERPSIYLRTR